jgi:rRNA-processing protein FCF1
MKYLFLDTNILLHYNDYEQIKWSELFDDNDFTIIIADTVLSEIDKQKDSSRGKIQKTAKKYSSRFCNILTDQYASPIKIEFPPYPDFTNAPDLKESRQDDCILLAAIQSKYDNADKYVVTSDNGMLTRCKRHGINFKILDDSYRKKDELSDEEKKINDLESELNKYKYASSKPMLCFSDESSSMNLKSIKICDIQERVDAYKHKLEAEYPQRGYYKPTIINGFKVSDKAYSDEEVDKYNSELTAYIEEKCEIYKQRLMYSEIDKLFYEIKFSVFNKGTAKSGNLAVQILLPSDTDFYDENSRFNLSLKEPKLPRLETAFEKQLREAQDNALVLASFNYQSYNKSYDIQEEHWDISSPIDTTEPLLFEKTPLLHYLNCNITIRGGIYIELSKPKTIIIPWAIVDENHPEPITGQLEINIT